MNNICALCRGRGSIFCVQAKQAEWWTCQACGGAGVRVMHGPAEIEIKTKHVAKAIRESKP